MNIFEDIFGVKGSNDAINKMLDPNIDRKFMTDGIIYRAIEQSKEKKVTTDVDVSMMIMAQ